MSRCPSAWLFDGDAPGRSRGVDVDEDGNGVLPHGCRYQLVREHDALRQGTVGEGTVEFTFLEPGAEAYTFA